ncbi:MAG TPA: NUDIX hydrolase [Pseudonocardiaceae bacterium]|nr:NUDIX hydrolase [Pseudonocardiaceae bacterium]
MPFRGQVSVKGVVLLDDRVLLVRNERAEWELPGGRLELDETPEQCVVREIAEETGWAVTCGPILDSYVYRINLPDIDARIFIVTYGCYLLRREELRLSAEHNDIGLFGRSDLASLNLPSGYRRSVRNWFAHRENRALGV